MSHEPLRNRILERGAKKRGNEKFLPVFLRLLIFLCCNKLLNLFDFVGILPVLGPFRERNFRKTWGERLSFFIFLFYPVSERQVELLILLFHRQQKDSLTFLQGDRS